MPPRFKALSAAFLIIALAFLADGCSKNRIKTEKNELKLKIAVLPFEDTAKLSGKSSDPKIAAELADRLAETGRFVIVPWTEIEKYMNDKRIPTPLTQTTAGVVGRALGINTVVMGAISEMSQLQKRVGWLHFIPLTIPYVNESSDVLTAVLVAKVIDIDTGIVLGADVGSGTTKTGLTQEDFSIGKPSSAMDKNLMNRTWSEAINQLSKSIIKVIQGQKWKSFIVEVNNQGAVIAAGENGGLTPGRLFVVYSVGEKITNVAGQTYVIPGPAKARLEAVKVYRETTEVKVLSGQVFLGETVVLQD